ncbi:MAG: curli-like amyloid fiber formation chaperone CsgH [Paracoccaceae bacterium]
MLTSKTTTTRLIAILAGLAGIAAAGALAGNEPAQAPLRCGVEISQQAGNVRLKSWVESRIDEQGSYELSIRRAGAGGSAAISQSGDFDVAAGETQTLSSAAMNGSADRIDAELVVITNDNRIVCEQASPKTDL